MFSFGPLHHRHEYAIFAPFKRGDIDPSLPILLQLRPTQHHLHILYTVQIRLQEMDTTNLERRMAVLYPRLHGRRGKLFHRACIPLRESCFS